MSVVTSSCELELRSSTQQALSATKFVNAQRLLARLLIRYLKVIDIIKNAPNRIIRTE